ncbi:3-oxoacyl-ACP synthase [Paucibacter sp. KBW04]|uniref:3-oxoacyl-ACP synthase n=1 Tax=Paucibacter sp. KBW04 TaxID=2153361 RepID=UPI000F55CD51|nr:3-oxoacyl-ACP synthase [Paucibacter sp. KBW04]RQO59935.1 3-oxoacyl-ACP synthase [Paucibacter sp. KBW04]
MAWPPDLIQGLSTAQAQHLADLLPFLACGEESAVFAFEGSLLAAVPAAAQAVLQGIASDERRHADLLAHLRQLLPQPRLQISFARLAFFFRRLQASQVDEHLARVAALDLAVCRLLQVLLHPQAGLAAAPGLHRALCELRQDEARHVRQARSLARQLGCSAQRQAALDEAMRLRLLALLQPVAASLQSLSQRPGA